MPLHFDISRAPQDRPLHGLQSREDRFERLVHAPQPVSWTCRDARATPGARLLIDAHAIIATNRTLRAGLHAARAGKSSAAKPQTALGIDAGNHRRGHPVPGSGPGERDLQGTFGRVEERGQAADLNGVEGQLGVILHRLAELRQPLQQVAGQDLFQPAQILHNSFRFAVGERLQLSAKQAVDELKLYCEVDQHLLETAVEAVRSFI
jgi:hypothetical protein